MIEKLKDLATKHYEAKHIYDEAVDAYQKANCFTFDEKAEKYAEVQLALVDVQFRLNMLQAHINDMVMDKVREELKDKLTEEFEAEQTAEHTDHEPLFNPEYEG